MRLGASCRHLDRSYDRPTTSVAFTSISRSPSPAALFSPDTEFFLFGCELRVVEVTVLYPLFLRRGGDRVVPHHCSNNEAAIRQRLFRPRSGSAFAALYIFSMCVTFNSLIPVVILRIPIALVESYRETEAAFALRQQPALCVVATDRKFWHLSASHWHDPQYFLIREVLLVDFAGVHTLNEIGERSELRAPVGTHGRRRPAAARRAAAALSSAWSVRVELGFFQAVCFGSYSGNLKGYRSVRWSHELQVLSQPQPAQRLFRFIGHRVEFRQ